MSGPKGATYRVVSAAELRRREQEQARAALERANGRLAQARAAAEAARAHYGPSITQVTSESTARAARAGSEPADLDAAAAEVEAAAAAAEERLRREITAARNSAVAQAFRAATGGGERSRRASGDAAESTAAAGAAREDGDVQEQSGDTVAGAERQRQREREAAARAAAVERVLGRLAPGVPDAEHERLTESGRQVLAAASQPRAEQLLDVLRAEVIRAGERAAERARHETRVRELAGRLDGREGAEAELARAALAGLAAREPLDATAWRNLTDTVEAARASADRSADRLFAAAAVTAALRDVGYQVEEGFEVLLARDGHAHVRSPRWSTHAVRVNLRREDHRVRFRVVAADRHSADPAGDVRAEQEWCETFDRLRPALRDHGVALEVTSRTPVGSTPVSMVTGRLPFAGETRGRPTRRDDERRRGR